MKTISIKELMVPVEAYATVHRGATLREAVLALEQSQMTLSPSRHKNRALLLLWIVGFLVIYPIVGFPEGILEQATQVLEAAVR